MAGLAQKGGLFGATYRMARNDKDIKTVRLGSGGAKVLIGGDLVISGSEKLLIWCLAKQKLLQLHQQMTRDTTKILIFSFQVKSCRKYCRTTRKKKC